MLDAPTTVQVPSNLCMNVLMSCIMRHALQVLGALLRHQVVRSAGTLLAWTLQRPELIDADQLPTLGVRFSRTLTALSCHSRHCLGRVAVGVVRMDEGSSSSSAGSGSVGTLAAAMTQQLEQSGEKQAQLHAHVRSCDSTHWPRLYIKAQL
jgi:hypothetical protein